jgi:hypothetical protein
MHAICAFLLFIAADPDPKETGTPRKPHPLAPSLPLLTDKEEAELDGIVNKFIEADTGKLSGSAAKSAIDDFKSLGPEATFALIRGFNRSAHIDHSCPALTIARKLTGYLSRTSDTELLQYAKENIGVGVRKTRHGDVIQDLKLGCSRRIVSLKNAPTPKVVNELKNKP